MHGVSTRKVDDLVKALGVGVRDLQDRGVADLRRARRGTSKRSGTGRSTTSSSPTCSSTPPTSRPASAAGSCPGRWSSPPGSPRTGDREVLGIDVGDIEDGAFWTAFLRALAGPRAHRRAARDLRRTTSASSTRSKRCSLGAALATLPRALHAQRPRQGPQGVRARWSPPRSARSSLNPTPHHVRAQLDEVATHARPPVPRRRRHAPRRRARTSSRSPRSRSRTGARSGPRTRSSGSTARSSGAPTSSASSPTTPPSLRLVTAVLVETHDEWAVADRRYLSEGSMATLYDQPDLPVLIDELTAAKIAS